MTKTMRVDDLDVALVTSRSLLVIAASTILVGILSFVAVWWQHPRYGRNRGPKLFPFVGCLPQMLMNANRFYDWAADEILKTPTMTMRAPLPGWDLIRTANPANVEHILKTNFDNYPKGQHFRSLFSDFAGVGMLNADGNVWKLQRKFASPNFSTQMMRGMALTSLQKGLEERFIPILESFCDCKAVVDLQDLFFRSTFDTLSQFAFGFDPGCLNSQLSPVPVATAFDDALELSCRRMVNVLPPWRMQKLLNVGSERKLRQSLLTLDAFAYDLIATRRKELADGQCKQDSDVLSNCIQLADEFVKSPEMKQRLEDDPRSKSTPVQASDLFLRDFMINAILAGRDTSASGLSWFFWMLSRNPEVEAMICDEIQSTLASRRDQLPKDSEPGETTPVKEELKTFSFDELKGMHYLHAALTESMRLYPPVPHESKTAAADDILPDGTPIAKGTVILLQMYSMGRSTSIWGSDCLAFRPDRFLRAGSFVPPSPFAYPVFLAPPRMCLGMDMGMMQMKLIAATLLRRYTFVVRDGHHAKGVLSLTMKIEEGLPVYVRRRV